ALVTHDAPFVVVNLVATNLTTVPASIRSRWPSLRFFIMEHGQLREFPRVVAAMKLLERISVCDNEIQELPALASTRYSVLNFARNPVQALPPSLPDTSQLTFLSFEHTLVADTPWWLASALKKTTGSTVSAFGLNSSYCQKQQAGATAAASSKRVVCGTPSPRVNGLYPLDIVTSYMSALS
ncbi:hypothetical protein PybrP1_012584, partial [[Pythium] brassicae (nom. inval.)]